jgi:hypothetical protein
MTITTDRSGHQVLRQRINGGAPFDFRLTYRDGSYWQNDSDFGDRYRVRADGNLQLTDNEGPIRVAQRVASQALCR